MEETYKWFRMKSHKHINSQLILTFSVYAPSSEKNRDRDVAAAAVRLVFCAFSFCGCGAVNVLAMRTPFTCLYQARASQVLIRDFVGF